MLPYTEFEFSGHSKQEVQDSVAVMLPLPHVPFAPATHAHKLLSRLSESRLHSHEDSDDVHGVHMPAVISSVNPT